MPRVNYQISLYPPHENRNIERKQEKKHQEISGAENLERKKDGTNKRRTCLKGLSSAKEILYLPSTICQTKLNKLT